MDRVRALIPARAGYDVGEAAGAGDADGGVSARVLVNPKKQCFSPSDTDNLDVVRGTTDSSKNKVPTVARISRIGRKQMTAALNMVAGGCR